MESFPILTQISKIPKTTKNLNLITYQSHLDGLTIVYAQVNLGMRKEIMF